MPDHIGDDPRTAARERAVSILYEAESRGIPVSEVIVGLVVPADPLTENLVLGFERDHEVVDSIIERLSTNWTLDRMPAIDRAVLRLAVQELRTAPNTPTAVVLDEAVELAKRFSTEQSGGFVNGVLASAARELRPAQPSGPATATD